MKALSGLLGNMGKMGNQSAMELSPMVELLESRQLLSAAWSVGWMLGEPMQGESGLVVTFSNAKAVTQRAAKAAVPSIVGNFVGTYRDGDGYVAQVILKITAQTSTTIQGRFYSGDLGGFDVAGSGTISSKGLILGVGGKSDTLSKGTLQAKVSSDGKTITGTLSANVMGFASKGQIELTKTTKRVPDKIKTNYPSMLGKYAGTITRPGYSEKVSSSITKQVGGNLWGTGYDAKGRPIALTGTVLANGKFRMIGRGDGLSLEMYGTLGKGGVIQGYMETNDNGDTNTFTYWMKRR